MWASFVRDGWSELGSLMSPRFFSVLPPRDVKRALLALTKNHRNQTLRRKAIEARRDALVRIGVPIRLDARAWRDAREAETTGALSGLQLPPSEVGARVLRLFFHQLYDPHATLLDLRSAVFAQKDGELLWTGGALIVEWDATFLAGLRELYLGYYRSDVPRFRRALGPLGLATVEHELWKTFGGADPRNVTFDFAEFRHTFVELLKRCREVEARLHPDFVPLGIYLTCLYEHLEACGGSHDVLSAFNDVQALVTRTDAKYLAAQSAAL